MPTAMRTSYDVIVAGAGHNGLVTAAYLSAAGLRVLLLEDQDTVGGNARSEELIPGYIFDSGSSGHTLIQATPLFRKDELGLLAHGLRYEFPELLQMAMLPDGTTLQIHVDVEGTANEIARLSRADADAYRRLEPIARQIVDVIGPVERSPIGSVEISAAVRRRAAQRAWDVIGQRFEDPRIQAWLCMEASMVLVPPDQAWTARYVYSSFVSRHTPRTSWGTPVGGSGALTDSLRAAFERFGGVTRTGHRVARILIRDSKAVGVECANGETFLADTAVVSSIHVKHLVDMVPPGTWTEEFVEAIDEYVSGSSIGATYIATTEPPLYRDKLTGRQVEALAAVMPSTLEDALGWGNRGLLRQPSLSSGMMFTHTGTLQDPSRAVDGGHTVKCISWQPNDLESGPERWHELRDELEQFHLTNLRRYAPNMTPDKIVGTVTRTPYDFTLWNLHNVGGSAHGGEQLASQVWESRPVPGWSNHRMPISGLYQTGATTHPGGGITGVSGRNAAIAVLEDLGTSIETALANPRA